MNIRSLKINDFRNIAQADLEFADDVNVIVGDNGSGKTSLLEAIYYLGHAKSFRTPHSTQLITLGEKQLVLYGVLGDGLSIGVSRNRTAELTKIARQVVQKKSELVTVLPIQFINPDVHKILDDSPRYRRRFLEWGVFHVEHSYLDLWRQYQGILKQRNAALKNRWDKKLIDSWNADLTEVAGAITEIKSRYVEELFAEASQILVGFEGLQLSYQQGWPESQSFADSLHSSLESDYKTGFTKYGPHRSDIKINLLGVAAKDVVSRGQQKYLACALKIAQVNLFHKKKGQTPVFLVDDLFSELDRVSVNRVVDLLLQTRCQLFLTAIDKQPVLEVLAQEQRKMFHVEHGVFKEVV